MKKISILVILLGAVLLVGGVYGWIQMSQASRSLGLGTAMTSELLDWGMNLGAGDSMSLGERIGIFFVRNHSGLIWGGIAGIALGAVLRALNKKAE